MTKTYMLLLDFLGKALFQKSFTVPDVIDWNALYKEAKAQAVIPLVLETADAMGILPEVEKNRWVRTAMSYVCQNEQLLAEQRAVLSLLEENHVPCAILKGSSSAMWYPDPALRVMGDIDLLVAPENQLPAVKLLQGRGYGEVENVNHPCHLTVSKGRLCVEVHKEPNGMFINRDSGIAEYLQDFFADGVAKRQHLNGLPVLSDEHQAVVLLMHKLEHFLAGGLGLRQLCDWAVFAQKRLDAQLFATLQPVLKKCGLLHFTEIITYVCVAYLGLPDRCVPWAMDSDKALAEEVMEHIFVSGNFGIKEAGEGARFFTDAQSSGRMGNFWRAAVSTSQNHFPACKKYKILLPIGIVVAFWKYLGLRRQGKRKALHPVKDYKTAGAKHRLYRELKPFVTEEI